MRFLLVLSLIFSFNSFAGDLNGCSFSNKAGLLNCVPKSSRWQRFNGSVNPHNHLLNISKSFRNSSIRGTAELTATYCVDGNIGLCSDKVFQFTLFPNCSITGSDLVCNDNCHDEDSCKAFAINDCKKTGEGLSGFHYSSPLDFGYNCIAISAGGLIPLDPDKKKDPDIGDIHGKDPVSGGDVPLDVDGKKYPHIAVNVSGLLGNLDTNTGKIIYANKNNSDDVVNHLNVINSTINSKVDELIEKILKGNIKGSDTSKVPAPSSGLFGDKGYFQSDQIPVGVSKSDNINDITRKFHQDFLTSSFETHDRITDLKFEIQDTTSEVSSLGRTVEDSTKKLASKLADISEGVVDVNGSIGEGVDILSKKFARNFRDKSLKAGDAINKDGLSKSLDSFSDVNYIEKANDVKKQISDSISNFKNDLIGLVSVKSSDVAQLDLEPIKVTVAGKEVSIDSHIKVLKEYLPEIKSLLLLLTYFSAAVIILGRN